jgi:hypothetical protein
VLREQDGCAQSDGSASDKKDRDINGWHGHYSFRRSENDLSVRIVRLKWFRSFSMVAEDQSARIQENHTISRPRPQSFSS